MSLCCNCETDSHHCVCNSVSREMLIHANKSQAKVIADHQETISHLEEKLIKNNGMHSRAVKGFQTEIARLQASNEYLKRENKALMHGHNIQANEIQRLQLRTSEHESQSRPTQTFHPLSADYNIWKRLENIEHFLHDRFRFDKGQNYI